MSKVLTVVALLAAPALAAAHDLWVERTPDGFVARRGHRGGEALALDARKVKAIRCLDARGELSDVIGRPEPRELRIAAVCAAVSVVHDGGYWSRTPDGDVNLPKNQARNVVKSWASRQYGKWIDARSPHAGAVLGEELELVPVTDLAKARAGDEVTLRVLSGGQSVRGAVIEVDHRRVGATDAKGEIRLRIGTAGVEAISTFVRRPRATPEADAEVLEASLTFEVAR